MRSEPDKFKRIRIRQPVDQHQIGLQVAISVILPFPSQSMIAHCLWQWNVGGQQ